MQNSVTADFRALFWALRRPILNSLRWPLQLALECTRRIARVCCRLPVGCYNPPASKVNDRVFNLKSLRPPTRQRFALPHGWSCGVALLVALGSGHANDHLPPVIPWTGASEALIAARDNPWITPSEKTDLTETPTYSETIDYLRKLAAASPLLSLQEFGRPAQGRPL
jgi:hypothetical protein